jgi:hypothetical protein
MCFSAGASFTAGAVLSVIGVVSIRECHERQQIPFASIPLLFAIQQIFEGFVWLSFTNPDFAFVRWSCTYGFIFFAQVVWPFWVPFSILTLEHKKYHKTVEKGLLSIGSLTALYLGYCLLTYSIEPRMIGYHIAYKQFYPSSLQYYGAAFYMIATIVPPFFSRIRRMWMLGIAIMISYIVTSIFYTDYITSVWCFFASILSIAVYAIIYQVNFTYKQKLRVPGLING